MSTLNTLHPYHHKFALSVKFTLKNAWILFNHSLFLPVNALQKLYTSYEYTKHITHHITISLYFQ
jgi:hypothetical protein